MLILKKIVVIIIIYYDLSNFSKKIIILILNLNKSQVFHFRVTNEVSKSYPVGLTPF